MFGWVTGRAREVHWYLDGGVEDSLDGRFAMLATIAALVTVRLERAGDAGTQASAALTERFIEAMEAEHREMGLGDPKLGRTVRKLVGSLARRVDLWRATVDRGDWSQGAQESVYGNAEPLDAACAHTAAALRALWEKLESAQLAAVAEGRVE